MIVSVTLNPSVDHTVYVDGLKQYDTNRVSNTEKDAGGKGVNLSRVVAELGGETVCTGFLGGGSGAYIRHVLDEEEVKHDFIKVKGSTRVNFSVEDGSGKPPTTFNERGPEISPHDLDKLQSKLVELCMSGGWLCMGGSLPPGVEKTVYREMALKAKQSGLKVVIDADGEPMQFAYEAAPDFVKPNADEATRLLGREINKSNAVEAAKELRSKLTSNEDAIVVISLGGDGAVLSSSEGDFFGESPKVEVKSTIGSGDSLIAGFIYGLTQGKSHTDCLRLGIACGAATASTNGSEIARKPVIDELLPKVVVQRA